MKLAGMRGQEKVGGEKDTGAGVKAEGFLGWENWNGREEKAWGRFKDQRRKR